MEYKYMRKDFIDFPATLKHMDIFLNFFEDRVEVVAELEVLPLQDIEKLELNAEELKIISIELEGKETDYKYENNKIMLAVKKKKGEAFKVRTGTHCFPSDNILEGIYRDTTPEGAPQQYMSQCEMWGFQRIMPVIDDPRAKCTMRTKMEADTRYTHIISNGDVDRKTNPEGKPLPVKGNPSRKAITYVNNVPMSPYLFLAIAGTWDELVDSVTYPGGRTVRLEYLVPPGMTEYVRIPMEILKKSVLWIYEKHDYEYPHEVYRTITMNKSDAGGMENVGNTTIITDAALIDEHTMDGYVLYAYSVIVHEFEHNQCGSETTMETPFDMWLNEAYTVEVEREFVSKQFDASFKRISNVESIRDPLFGPLAIEDAGYHGKIRRDGFNDPRELIDGVTYVKAAEVIRMLRLVLGPEKFREAKALYFSRYKDKNANTEQFFECFEEVHGKSLFMFKEGWLLRAGYPKVNVRTSYNDGIYRMEFEQGDELFHIPIELALVNSMGKDMHSELYELTEKKQVLEIKTRQPAFPSINRDYSFYGTITTDMKPEQLRLQARKDPNHFSRIEAMKQLTDMQRIRLLHNSRAAIDPEWVALYGPILNDRTISKGLKSRLLAIGEQPLDRKYAAWFTDLLAAREALMKAVWEGYRSRILAEFTALDTYKVGRLEKGIEDRALKAVLLSYIAIEDSPDTHYMLIGHYRNATTANDRVTALTYLNRSKSDKRRALLDEVFGKWKCNLSGYANYLRIISSGTHDSVFEEIEAEKARPEFDIKQPTLARALIFPMAFNTKMVWTDQGMLWVRDMVLELTQINNNLAARLLNTFQHAKLMRSPHKEKVLGHLKYIVSKVDRQENPVIYAQASAYLN